jgi:hypothetical protein
MKQGTKEVTMHNLGVAFGRLLGFTPIRSRERMERECSLFLKNCGITQITSEEAKQFDAGFSEGYASANKEKHPRKRG